MVIAIVGQKGGVGKSTLAIFCAAEMYARGHRVLLIDADPQGTARTWGDVAAEEGHDTPTIVSMGATMHRPGQLDHIGQGYDITLIDCPPRHNDVQRSALMVADVALLPCGPSPADAWALTSALELIQEAKIVRPYLMPTIVMTKVRSRTRIARASEEALAGTGFPILENRLSYRTPFQEALAAGLGITAFAPKDAAALELSSLVDELMTFATRTEKHGETESNHQAA